MRSRLGRGTWGQIPPTNPLCAKNHRISVQNHRNIWGLSPKNDGEIPVEAELSAKEEKPKAKAEPKRKASVVRAGCQKKPEVTKVPVNSEGDDGALMKSVRQRLGLSQAEMGRRLGTYQAVVSQIERGKAHLRPGWAERLRVMR